MDKVCTVEGCEKPLRSSGAAFCGMHYHRLYRFGTLELTRTHRETLRHSQGYTLRYAPDHPLTMNRGRHHEYEHRVVYYDLHGEGPFSCYHCQQAVSWKTLHIDHLNDIKSDNSPTNLVASCGPCNRGRGMWKQAAAMRAKGRILVFDGRAMCVSEWSRAIGISRHAIMERLKKGWPVDRALSEPRGKFGPKRGYLQSST